MASVSDATGPKLCSNSWGNMLEWFTCCDTSLGLCDLIADCRQAVGTTQVCQARIWVTLQAVVHSTALT